MPHTCQSEPAQKEESGEEKRALDLFSGSGATGIELHKMGYEVVSLDNNPRAHPVGYFICKDILCWDYKVFPVGHFCIIAATPPCTSYSTANNLRPRNFAVSGPIGQAGVRNYSLFPTQEMVD